MLLIEVLLICYINIGLLWLFPSNDSAVVFFAMTALYVLNDNDFIVKHSDALLRYTTLK